MKVTVRDPSSGPYVIRTVEIEIADVCPRCGTQRGEPVRRHLCQNEEWYGEDVWANPCGHTDDYPDIRRVAQARAAK